LTDEEEVRDTWQTLPPGRVFFISSAGFPWKRPLWKKEEINEHFYVDVVKYSFFILIFWAKIRKLPV
jgi:hypothetical protein